MLAGHCGSHGGCSNVECCCDVGERFGVALLNQPFAVGKLVFAGPAALGVTHRDDFRCRDEANLHACAHGEAANGNKSQTCHEKRDSASLKVRNREFLDRTKEQGMTATELPSSSRGSGRRWLDAPHLARVPAVSSDPHSGPRERSTNRVQQGREVHPSRSRRSAELDDRQTSQPAALTRLLHRRRPPRAGLLSSVDRSTNDGSGRARCSRSLGNEARSREALDRNRIWSGADS